MTKDTREEIKKTIINLCNFVNEIATKENATPAELEAMTRAAGAIVEFATNSISF